MQLFAHMKVFPYRDNKAVQDSSPSTQKTDQDQRSDPSADSIRASVLLMHKKTLFSLTIKDSYCQTSALSLHTRAKLCIITEAESNAVKSYFMTFMGILSCQDSHDLNKNESGLKVIEIILHLEKFTHFTVT